MQAQTPEIQELFTNFYRLQNIFNSVKYLRGQYTQHKKSYRTAIKIGQ